MNEKPQKDLLALRIRNLIAAREANTAQANYELSRGEWMWDHAQYDSELAVQIAALFEQAQAN